MQKKKLDGRTILVASALFIAIFAQVGFLGSVFGPEGQQHNIWGNESNWGVNPPGSSITTDEEISAWIDGVSYGSNLTVGSSNGEYDLYVDSDSWGIPADDAVKTGGYDGDTIYYFLNYHPMNYFFNISTTTSTFYEGAYEQVDGIYFDTQTEIDNSADTYLRGLKINEVIITPGDGFPQYVYLYDPAGELTEAEIEANYYLQKDDDTGHTPDGPIFDFTGNENNVINYPAASRFYYINLSGFTLNSQDELKLVWDNPGTTVDNICNGTDVIVDRVEWGNYINYINPTTPPDDRDYDNTSMVDYPGTPGSGESIMRVSPGVDTDDCDADFALQGVATERGVPFGPPPTVDYVQIRSAGSGGGVDLGVPGNYPIYPVGEMVTFYGSAYNSSSGYMGSADGSSTWNSNDPSIVTVSSPNSNSLITCDNVNWGGPVTITIDDGSGHTNTTQVTVMQPTVDYIEITDDYDGTPLPDAGKSPGFTQWGYCSGYNNTAGYIGVFAADWEAQGGDASLLNGTTTIHNGITGTTLGEVWLNATYNGKTDSVMYTIGIGPVPGFPTLLVVHKGGGQWTGNPGDLVLNWTAPIDNYGALALNIVYYDMDLSNGFQYTDFIEFEPNSTSAGDPDWCILPGWEADANSYAFVVRTTGDVQGGAENLTGTNMGYKYPVTLQKTGPTLTNFLRISLPYVSDYTMASDIAGPGKDFTDNTIIEKLSRWDYATQRFEHRSYVSFPTPGWSGDFVINPGDVILLTISASSPYQWNIVGSYDNTVQFTLLKTGPELTNFMWISLPYHKNYVDATDIADASAEFTDNSVIEKLSQWDYATQRYEHRSYVSFPTPGWSGNFVIFASPADAILFTITATSEYYYTPEVITT